MLNRVTLLGTIGAKGVSVRFLEGSGTRVGSFLIRLTETNDTGRMFTAYHAIECYGRALQTADTLEPGDVVLVEGKLRRRKGSDDRWETGVLALGLTKVVLPALVED